MMEGAPLINQRQFWPSFLQYKLSFVLCQVLSLVEALFRMSGNDMGEESQENISDCVKEIIETVDVDGDGIITKEEFVEHAMKSKFVSSIKM